MKQEAMVMTFEGSKEDKEKDWVIYGRQSKRNGVVWEGETRGDGYDF